MDLVHKDLADEGISTVHCETDNVSNVGVVIENA